MVNQAFYSIRKTKDLQLIKLGEDVIVFGINVYTNEIIQKFNVIQVIDDFYDKDFFNEIPVIRLADVNPFLPIINCAGGQINKTQFLISQVSDNFVHYAELQKCYPSDLRELIFNEGFEACYNKNINRFNNIYSLLSDQESKKIWRNIVAFRITQRLEYLESFENLVSEQYFESFIPKLQEQVFFDVGAYDGETSLKFQEWTNGLGKIFYFEPNKTNFENCKIALSEATNCRGFNLGLANFNGTAYISDARDTSGLSMNAADMPVNCMTMDTFCSQEIVPTFVKIDVEGFELSILEGMERLIKNESPTIAISIYHKPEHFFEIPEYVFSLNSAYSVYVRHYTESIYETVMFFIPADKRHQEVECIK